MADKKKQKLQYPRNKKKKKGCLSPKEILAEPKPAVEPQIDPKTKRTFIIKNTGSTEGMKDAAKIKGKPHSSPEGRFMSGLRSMPLKVVTFKNGGSVRLARKGGGKAYGKNS